MFCPVCKTEYRPGFVECSDCHVALVEELSELGTPTSYEVLWKGENADFAAELAGALKEAGIVCAAIPLDLLYRNSRDAVDVAMKPLFGSAVSVAKQDYAAAKQIKEKLLREGEGEEHPDSGTSHATGLQEFAEIPNLPLKWDPATATVELWRGSDARALHFRADSLRGVGIPARESRTEVGQDLLMVRAQDEERAREVLRQIEESAVLGEPSPDEVDYEWTEEPIRSYTLLWTLAILYAAIAVVFWKTENPNTLAYVLWRICSSIANIGILWMLYQSIRYEVYPLSFILLSFVPYSFVWYYRERYKRRRGVRRLPVAIRLRTYPPRSA